MKDLMEIARSITSLDETKTHREIFNMIKEDKAWLADIVNAYVEEIIPDVLTIKNIAHDYNNPLDLSEKDGAESEVKE